MEHSEQMEHLEACPICRHNDSTHFLDCVDHTVSKENFTIVECDSCHFRYTNPRPDQTAIVAYYKAEAYVSHTNTNKGLVNRAYHIVRKKTLQHKLNLLNQWCQDKTLLDYGSGAGAFASHCKDGGWEVLGLEPDPDARAVALKDFGVEAKEIDSLKTLPDASRDAITLWHVLEHVHLLNETIEQFKRVLKKEGTLFIAVPNCSSYDAEFYKANWAAYDLPRHLYHFRPKNISELFTQHGFEVKEVLPMKYDAYYVSMLSEKIKGGSAVKGIFKGWQSNMRASKKDMNYSSQIYILQHKE